METLARTDGLFFQWVEDEIALVGPGQDGRTGAAGLPKNASLLAWHVVAAPDRPARWRDHRNARRSPASARRVAAAMLRLAIAGEFREAPEGAGENDLLAQWREAEDLCLQFAAEGQDHLTELARDLAIDDPTGAARDVCAAIRSELLPGLHAVFLVGAPSQQRAAFHRSRLGKRTALAGTPLAALMACVDAASLRAARAALEAGRPAQALQGFEQCNPANGRAAGRLAAEVARVLRSRKPPSAEERRLAKSLVEKWPFDYGGILAVGQDLVETAMSLASSQDFHQAAMLLAEALAINPGDTEIPRIIDTLEKAQVDLAKQVSSLAGMGRMLNARGEAVLRGARKVGAARAYLESKAAHAVRERSIRAVFAQIAARLGLDPTDDGHVQAAASFAEACTTLPADARPEAVLPPLLEKLPVLAEADRSRLEWLVEHRQATVLAAAFELPPPLPPEAPEVFARNAAAAARERLSALRPRPAETARRLSLPRWLFQPVDTRYKALGALGGLALVAAGGLATTRFCDHVMRDRDYAALVAAVDHDDQAGAVDAAGGFLAHTAPGFVDYRVTEVTTTYERELLRQLLAAQQRSDPRATTDILPRIRRLQEWMAADRSKRSAR